MCASNDGLGKRSVFTSLLYGMLDVLFGSINPHAADDRHLPRARLETKIQHPGGSPVLKASECGPLVLLMARNAEIWGHLLDAATV